MKQQGFRLHPERLMFDRAIGFHLVKFDDSGQRLIADGITYASFPRGAGAGVRPAFELLDESGQELIDALWAIGLRPTQGRQSEGVTAAQGRHLEDMRAIAFGKLDVEKPV